MTLKGDSWDDREKKLRSSIVLFALPQWFCWTLFSSFFLSFILLDLIIRRAVTTCSNTFFLLNLPKRKMLRSPQESYRGVGQLRSICCSYFCRLLMLPGWFSRSALIIEHFKPLKLKMNWVVTIIKAKPLYELVALLQIFLFLTVSHSHVDACLPVSIL